jgi:predicted negative regulator of RcsB-dependent stress response
VQPHHAAANPRENDMRHPLLLPLALALGACASGLDDAWTPHAGAQFASLEYAHRQWQSRSVDEALQIVDRVIPQAADARVIDAGHLLAADILVGEDRPDEAEARLQKVRDRNSAAVREVRARLAIRRGQFADALAAIDGIADDDPLASQRKTYLGHLVRGLSAWSEGRTVEAGKHWDRIEDPELRRQVDQSAAGQTPSRSRVPSPFR